MSEQEPRRSLRIGYEIRDRVTELLTEMPLTVDQRLHKADRSSPKTDGISWDQLHWDVLARNDGYLDEFARSEDLYQHIHQGRIDAWVAVDIADALGVSLDDFTPTRAIDSPAYRAARLALAPRGLGPADRRALWRLARDVCDTYHATAMVSDEIRETFLRAIERATREAKEQMLAARSRTAAY